MKSLNYEQIVLSNCAYSDKYHGLLRTAVHEDANGEANIIFAYYKSYFILSLHYKSCYSIITPCMC